MFVPKNTKRRTERGELEGLKHSARWSGPPSASDVSLITIRLQVGICPAQSWLEIYHWIFTHLWPSLQSCPLLLCVLSPGLYSLDSSHSLGVSNGAEWVEECFWAHWPATAINPLSCSFNYDPQRERVRESNGTMYQSTQAASSTV